MHSNSCRYLSRRLRRALSIADRDAVLAHLGGSPIDAVLLVSEDRLITPEATGTLDELMASLGQLGPHRRCDARFHLHQAHAARLLSRDFRAADMAKPHEVARFLWV